MIIQLNATLVWDTEKPIYLQDYEVQEAVGAAMSDEPVSRTTEPCRDGNSRVLNEQYTFFNGLLSVDYIYNFPASSKEWAGLEDTIYTYQDGK
ncbi:hypothetical protein MUGA111182_09725 [Mucilaginibacter galii]|uniref:Uncharacterized protein n=1 Tax=Mucilaginibacter galii TaxID=2005073 RepID=A0A917N269_9SPHI|nr:hypothetical protein [Mucilaginibacter galii]GGI51199.1 hypothetical protein GCM10011425_24110 [Mucilaginibacter galii]